ncbi:MAG TPA: hypothetical protein VE779_14765 [Candidatus Angelobacter sp.]|nr:hypothetical protein [Candidatus Angelobacter sp.]
MRHLSVRSVVIALACLLLTAGLSAQRYTGHDHAVFHRPPATASTSAKHQSSPATGIKSAARTSPNAASQPGQHVVPAGTGTEVGPTTAPSKDHDAMTSPPGELNEILL